MGRYAYILLASILTSCGANKIEDLGSGYFITSNGMNGRAIGTDEELLGSFKYAVPGHVVEYVYDSKFILATEVPVDSVKRYAYQGSLPNSWTKVDSILSKSNYRRYYIIDKVRDTSIGPLSSIQYVTIRNNLNVPKALTLK
jgi:hypothetical protein